MSVRHEITRTADRRVRVQGRPVDSYPALSPEAERGTVRRVTEVGEDVLSRPCQEVTDFGSAELSTLIDDMFLTMHVADGAGLAANQVGVDLRLFVYDCPDDDGIRHVGHIGNPVLDVPEPGSRRLIDASEGCLSVPGATMTVPRTDRAVVRGLDKDGNPLVIEGTGYFARCLQHETDHLLGHTYLDRLSKRDRKEALRQMADRREEVFARRERKAARLTRG
ncbi:MULTISPECIES: peptide deformylase [Streptomyces]|uniref:Peptide deformylase n=2 Tax=Streptomyces rimosus subsp. rimosus TaxID=132474 RepID=L8F1G2_STRR1|nr:MULTISPECIES: peptide deformylase [Streptomyces]KOG70740.1 peptide deformylase [Kitasatospora aureofaciens]MYT47063.1 peptide deformylase [Streptomyces sp. SID5471]KEF08075.1 peptide deformylase [Streptomyces rimosus]KEF20962.1 peptide deformylase [Streptomyces rimosus]KOT29896.1 peptide deformylase [Streptomyces rimosus subsp. rimosus]